MAAGPFALVTVIVLVSYGDLPMEDLLISLPVLQHLVVDSKTLLEQRSDALDGPDCFALKAAQAGTHGG